MVVARSTIVACTVARTCSGRRAEEGNGVTPVPETSAGRTPLWCLPSLGVSPSFRHQTVRKMHSQAPHGIVQARPRPKQLYVRGLQAVS